MSLEEQRENRQRVYTPGVMATLRHIGVELVCGYCGVALVDPSGLPERCPNCGAVLKKPDNPIIEIRRRRRRIQ